jgi:hypothetical protein
LVFATFCYSFEALFIAKITVAKKPLQINGGSNVSQVAPGNSTNLVIGAVDLDRGQPGGRVFQLLGLRQLLRIEHPAPRREGPAADADVDLAGR